MLWGPVLVTSVAVKECPGKKQLKRRKSFLLDRVYHYGEDMKTGREGMVAEAGGWLIIFHHTQEAERKAESGFKL